MAKRSKPSKATKAKGARKRAPGSKPRKVKSKKAKPAARKTRPAQERVRKTSATSKRPVKGRKPSVSTRARRRSVSRAEDSITIKEWRLAEDRKLTKKQREKLRREIANDKARNRRAVKAAKHERELARRRRNYKRKSSESRGDELGYFIAVLEDMAARAVISVELSITEAEPGARTAWLVVGRFDPTEVITYGELDELFAAWRDDLILEARIHPQRMSQIRLVYHDPKAKRGEGDSIVSHTGPWEAVISEITAELDPDDEDSLAARYQETTVPHFYVYFSSEIVSSLSDAAIFSR